MYYNLWGVPEEAKPLSEDIKKLLMSVFGISGDVTPNLDSSQVKLEESRISAEHRAGLAKIVGEEYVSTEHEQRLRRAAGKSSADQLFFASGKTVPAPDAVVAPANEAELLAILQYCSQEGIAVVPFSGGTSVVGGLRPLRGKFSSVISVDMARINQLISIDEQSMTATFGAGIPGPEAEKLLHEKGYQIGHLPQSFPYAVLGGYAATRSSGQSSAGYGPFDQMVRHIRMVTPQGIWESSKAPFSAAGPDLRQLIIGSEGTFGIISEVTVNIHPVRETVRHEAFVFPDFATGAEALRKVTQAGTGVTVLRLSDEIESAMNLATVDDLGSDEKVGGCLAITMYEGTEEHARLAHEETRNIMLANGATSLGAGPAEEWEKNRFNAPSLRDSLIVNEILSDTCETATDWSNLINLKAKVTEKMVARLTKGGKPALVMCHISHVCHAGASLYFTFVAKQDEDPVAQYFDAKQGLLDAIEEVGGTVSHHHAVGTDHLSGMRWEIGDLGVTVLQSVKDALDPAGIMNPGKLIPQD